MSLLVEEHLVGLEVVEGRVLGGILARNLIGPAVERRVMVVHLVVLSFPGALLQLRLGNLRNIRPFTLFYIEVRKFESFLNLRLDLSLMRNSLTNSQERSWARRLIFRLKVSCSYWMGYYYWSIRKKVPFDRRRPTCLGSTKRGWSLSLCRRRRLLGQRKLWHQANHTCDFVPSSLGQALHHMFQQPLNHMLILIRYM